jgi:hypothetical protein
MLKFMDSWRRMAQPGSKGRLLHPVYVMLQEGSPLRKKNFKIKEFD